MDDYMQAQRTAEPVPPQLHAPSPHSVLLNSYQKPLTAYRTFEHGGEMRYHGLVYREVLIALDRIRSDKKLGGGFTKTALWVLAQHLGFEPSQVLLSPKLDQNVSATVSTLLAYTKGSTLKDYNAPIRDMVKDMVEHTSLYEQHTTSKVRSIVCIEFPMHGCYLTSQPISQPTYLTCLMHPPPHRRGTCSGAALPT